MSRAHRVVAGPLWPWIAAAIVATWAGAAMAAVDPLLVNRVEAALLLDPSEETFAPLEAAIEGREATPAEKRDLLGELARLRSRLGHHGEAARALTFQVDLIVRISGAQSPDLAPVLAAASDAWLAAGEATRALEAAERALESDFAYYGCDAPLLARAYRRLAAAARALGSETDAARADQLAADPAARCAGRDIEGSRGVVATNEFASANPDSFARIKVFYATDRARTGRDHPNDFYGGDRGPVEYGTMEVTVPRNHKPGEVEAPSLLKLEWRENPERHYVITRLEVMSDTEMFTDLRRTLADRRSEEAFVFVHGYNVAFSQAAKRTAQIAYDLNFDGAPILYSWPSRGSTFAYVRDEAVVRLSGRHLMRFLDDVVARSGAQHINLIAHSMGNRAMIDALELIGVRRSAKGQSDPLFEQAIFAAPDEDAALFAEMLKTVRPIARRVTLYGSQNDVALAASRVLHGDRNRAGQGGDAILVADGVDTIDMSELGSDILGHSYFAASASALTDMSWLFWQDASPDRRCGMDGKSLPAGRFWLFDPVRCDGPVLLSALTMLRAGGTAALARIEQLLARANASGEQAAAAEWDAIHKAAVAVMGAR